MLSTEELIAQFQKGLIDTQKTLKNTQEDLNRQKDIVSSYERQNLAYLSDRDTALRSLDDALKTISLKEGIIAERDKEIELLRNKVEYISQGSIKQLAIILSNKIICSLKNFLTRRSKGSSNSSASSSSTL